MMWSLKRSHWIAFQNDYDKCASILFIIYGCKHRKMYFIAQGSEIQLRNRNFLKSQGNAIVFLLILNECLRLYYSQVKFLRKSPHRKILITYKTISKSQICDNRQPLSSLLRSWRHLCLFTIAIPSLKFAADLRNSVQLFTMCTHLFIYMQIGKKWKSLLSEELTPLCMKAQWKIWVWDSVCEESKGHFSKHTLCWLWSQTLIKDLYLLFD